jgi:hypothetical protein
MLLSNVVYTTSIQVFNSIVIRGFQGREGCKVAGLELVRSLRGNRYRMMLAKQNSKISSVSCVPKPSHINTRGLTLASSLVWGSKTRELQADLRVIIPVLGKSVVSSRGGIGRPVASMGRSWPDYKRVQQPTISADALYSSDHGALSTSASMPWYVVSAYNTSTLTEPSMLSMTPVSSIL